MTEAAMKFDTQDIVVDEVLPHAPETIWKTLTTGELIDRWLMKSTGFQPVKGARFTLQTTPAGAWDGVIHCEVLEVIRSERLSYTWRGGHDGNAQYGSRLDTVVTWTLAKADERHKGASRAFRFRDAEERHYLPEFERGLEEDSRQGRQHFRRSLSQPISRSTTATTHRSTERNDDRPQDRNT